MNKIKALFSNKKVVAIFSIVLLLIAGISGFAYHNHSESQKRIAEELRLKEEALAKKVDEAKKVLDTKLENEDKLPAEDKTKLEAVKKQLTEAIEKKDEASIVKLQNELKTALNTAKDSITKVIADEKEAEEKRLAEEKAKQQAEATASNTTPRPTNNAPTTQPTKRTQASTGTVNNNSGTTTTQPTTPAPQPEKPKERKPIADWMGPGNSGKVFKTKKEANDWAMAKIEEAGTTTESKSEFSKKYGFTYKQEKGLGYWIESIQYNDGTVEYTVDFYS